MPLGAAVTAASLALTLLSSADGVEAVAAGTHRVAAYPVAVPAPVRNLSLSWALPDDPVGRQVRWLLGVITKPSVPTAQLRAHFDAQFPPAEWDTDVAVLNLSAPVRITSLDAGRAHIMLQSWSATSPVTNVLPLS